MAKFCKVFTTNNFEKKWDCRAVQTGELCRSRWELSNEFLVAKVGFDTAENEPWKVCPLSVGGAGAASALSGSSDSYRKEICRVKRTRRGGRLSQREKLWNSFKQLQTCFSHIWILVMQNALSKHRRISDWWVPLKSDFECVFCTQKKMPTSLQ